MFFMCWKLCKTTNMQFFFPQNSSYSCYAAHCILYLNQYVFPLLDIHRPKPPFILKSSLFHAVLLHLLGGVEGDVLASLAPPVHLSGERLGWTLLICMVSDLRRGKLEVKWKVPSEGHSSPYSIAVNKKHRFHGAVAVITVATSDWPSYSCSVTHRRHPKVIRRHHTASSGRSAAGSE